MICISYSCNQETCKNTRKKLSTYILECKRLYLYFKFLKSLCLEHQFGRHKRMYVISYNLRTFCLVNTKNTFLILTIFCQKFCNAYYQCHIHLTVGVRQPVGAPCAEQLFCCGVFQWTYWSFKSFSIDTLDFFAYSAALCRYPGWDVGTLHS